MIRKLFTLGEGWLPRSDPKKSRGAGSGSQRPTVSQDGGKENVDPELPVDTTLSQGGGLASFDSQVDSQVDTDAANTLIRLDKEVQPDPSAEVATELPPAARAPLAPQRPRDRALATGGNGEKESWCARDGLTFGSNFPADGTVKEVADSWKTIQQTAEAQLGGGKLWAWGQQAYQGKKVAVAGSTVTGVPSDSRTFRCPLHRRCSCPFKVRLTLVEAPADPPLPWSHKVVLATKGAHVHEAVAGKDTKGLSLPQKEFLAQNLEEPPQRALTRLLEAAATSEVLKPLPTPQSELLYRIQNLFKTLRKKKNEQHKMKTIADLEDLARRNEFNSSKPDQPGVLAIEIDSSTSVLRILFSTPRLLSTWRKTKVRAMDATYKLNKEGLPLLVAGIVAPDRTFHVSALACTSKEEEADFTWMLDIMERHLDEMDVVRQMEDKDVFYMSDAAPAIRNAFRNVSGAPFDHTLTCVFHMIAAHKKKVIAAPSKSNNHQALLNEKGNTQFLLDAVKILSRQGNPLIFSTLLHLFLSEVEARGELRYLQYFKRQWGEMCPHWQRFRVPPGVPMTNNGLERFNRRLKDNMRHKRPHLGKMISDIMTLLGADSLLLNPIVLEGVHYVPPISPRSWRECQEYMKKKETKSAEDVVEHGKRGHKVTAEELDLTCSGLMGDHVLVPTASAYHRWRSLATAENITVKDVCDREANSFVVMYLQLMSGSGANFFDANEVVFSDAVRLLETFHVLRPLEPDASQPSRTSHFFDCSCLDFRTNGICKHTMCEAIRGGKLTIPEKLLLSNLAAAGPRGGRPRKTAACLQRQEGEGPRPRLLFPNWKEDSTLASQASAAEQVARTAGDHGDDVAQVSP